DEHEAGRRRNRPAVARSSRLLLVGRQAVGHAEGDTPGELAGVDIDRRQRAPWRLLTHHVRGFVLEAPASAHVPVGNIAGSAPDALAQAPRSHRLILQIWATSAAAAVAIHIG